MWAYIAFYALYSPLVLWPIYFLALWLSKGSVRTLLLLFGLTALASCEAWLGSTVYNSQETPEHGFDRNWGHRPHLWSTVLLSVMLVFAVTAPIRSWLRGNKPAARKRLLVALPTFGAYVAYIWTTAAEFGLATLFTP